MATIDKYVIDVDVQGTTKIDALKTGIQGLGTALAGIGLASFIHSFLELADAISDLSDATGLSIGKIASFQEALQQAGGKAENAGKMIASFYQQVDKASQGSEQAQKALERVGISFADLGKLSEEALLDKTLDTLSKMPPSAERTAAAMEVFGKSIRSIDPARLNELLKEGDFAKIQEEIRKAGDMADKMAANMHTMEMAGISAFGAVTSALEPFIGKVEEGRLKLDQAEKIVYTIGAAFTLVFGAKVVASIVEVTTALVKFNAVLASTEAISALLGKNPLWKVIAGAAVALGVGAAAWDEYEKAVKKAQETESQTNGPKPGEAPTAGAPRKTQFYSDEELKARKIAQVTAEQTTLQMQKQNEEAQKLQRTIISTVGMEQDYAAYIKSTAQLEQDANNKILDLTKQIDVEKSKGRGTNQAVIAEYQKQQKEVENNLTAMKALKAEEYNRFQALKNQLTEINLAYDQLTYGFDALTKSQENAVQKQIINGTMTEEQARRHLDLENLAGQSFLRMEALKKQLIEANIQGDTRAAQVIQNKIDLEDEYYNAMKRNITESQQLEDQKRESTVAGSKEALKQIEASMTPYKNAQNAVNNMWGTMGSAIDKFVETGKLSFGDLARSMIQDILKIELRAQASQIFGSIFGSSGGGGGIISSIFSSIFGKASGGPVSGGTPYIVGEKGPELFMPSTSGTIVPNNQLSSMGGGTTNHVTNYTYNVSAIDSRGVAQFFAENRKTMLGTMQLAQKELPYGNR